LDLFGFVSVVFSILVSFFLGYGAGCAFRGSQIFLLRRFSAAARIASLALIFPAAFRASISAITAALCSPSALRLVKQALLEHIQKSAQP